MEKAAFIFAIVLAGSACLVPADDAGDSEDLAETSAALTSSKPGLAPEAAAWIEQNIPKWSVYLGGKGRDLHPGRNPWDRFTNVYYDDPRDSDVFAPVILVRKGEEDDASKWVQLSLTQHWMKGDRYFDELIECGTLTMMDLILVMGELAKHADSYVEVSPIHVLEAATREALRDLRDRSRSTCRDAKAPRFHTFAGMEEGPYGPPAIPSWVQGPDMHTYGPGPIGPTAPMDGNGRPLLPRDVTSTRPSLSQVPPNPAPPRTAEQNGVSPGDPKPKPSPFDKDYKPRSGEVREIFKCAGEVFYGYKAGCLELANKSVFEKSTRSFVSFMSHVGKTAQGQLDEVRWALRHHLFHDGKGAECAEGCGYLAGIAGNALTFGIAAICLAATAGTEGVTGAICAKPLEALVAGTAVGGTAGNVYNTWLNSYCVKNVCTER